MKKLIVLAASIVMAFVTEASASTWTIDTDHSTANFSIQHMAISKVKGDFENVSGKIEFLESGPNPFSLEIAIDPETIDTGVEKRDAHLKSADFFDVKTYPSIKFISTKVIPAGKGNFQVEGTLTMHGVSKDITVALEGLSSEQKDPWGNVRKGAQITGEINRKDFGIVYNAVLESGNLLIGEKADISVDLEFIKK
ncbi:YceI family protein [Desulfopila aestuarii]|uniref:Polyisoprenoid-binding protein YceI n=1 Tax=Desulfopila aestuarii DSM 18488 TaxID=1121416 RepID=A0A1M7YA65_9BACT|nr:YceI family protein [Desulfopila aestuarii]SHO49489.1 Polyisoprenoid-binding protein YceI [Desulfopila aestuarii DSM 18488]